jgi:HK97 family phage portal protein
MGLLLEATERRATKINPLSPGDPGIVSLFGLDATYNVSGETVTPSTAAGEETFFAAERYLSETIASLPLHLLRALNPRGSEKATDHWLYSRLHRKPNRKMAKYRFWRLLMNWLFYRGNAYVLIQPSSKMAPFELIPLHPDRTEPKMGDDGEIYYEFRGRTGGVVRLRFGEVMHVAFLPGEDGLKGRSILSYQVNAIGRALSGGKRQARLNANDARPGIILKSKKGLSPQAKKNLKEDWSDVHGGGRSGGIAVLEDDLDFSTVAMSNEDTQAVEMLQYNAESMARIARVPQHKVGLLERATFSNIEHQAIEAVQDSIMPICVNIEDEIRFSLLTEREQETMYAKFNLEGLLRGDFASRQAGLQIQRQNGIIDGNDWAETENRNPFEGGDIRLVQLNMIPLQLSDQVGAQNPADPRGVRRLPATSETRSVEMLHRLRSAYQPVIEDAARRMLRREADGIERQYRRQVQERSLAEFLAWLTTYYDEHRNVMAQTMAPSIASYAEAAGAEAASMVGADAPELSSFAASYLAALVARHITQSRAETIEILSSSAPAAAATAIEEMLRSWRNERPASVAQREIVQVAAAASRAVWQDAGVSNLRWLRSEDCPHCEELSGKIVGVRDEFAEGVQHPPLADGCTCTLVPA